MKRYFWIACFAFSLFVSCADSSKADVTSSKGVSSSTAKAAKAPNATKSKPSQKIKTAPIGLNKPKQASGSIQIDVSDTTAKKGEEACVSISARSFNAILGLQYSIVFDPTQLKFKKSNNYGLDGLSQGSFGATKVDEGSLNFLWFDMNVKGISVPDATVLYDLCFQVLAEKGTTCEVTISDKPLKMEVVGPNKSKLNLESTSGKISVQ